ncbi:tetratricopeptide repeat protein [Azospirillum sp. INR13]|uniref:tetratricopeptide repeat protein n=1 Tax=Azospirillum sp. INR13 TaxID=2596919 RepID=UPI00189276C1|nr:tetratricopeptide repeat protein [Azospirillum sp. INR13]MBF5093929.1 tetratricopeptide repeat protein [Azospirillum sp. INR13]
MTDPSGPAGESDDSGDEKNVALNRALLREFLKEQVGFQFAIAVIDDDRAREDTVAELGRELTEEGIDWVVIDLRSLPEDVVLLSEIRHRLEPLAGRPAAVGVLGLEWHLDNASGGIRDTITTLLANANFQRDAFPEVCPVPLVLWATSLSLPTLPKLMPDLWHWRVGTFDLCDDPPDTPWADRLERMVPRPEKEWQAQPKEELWQRIELLRQVLDEIGPDGSLRRALLLLEFANVMERAGQTDQALNAAHEALDIATKEDEAKLRAAALGYVARMKSDRGYVNEALSLHEERLATYERVGDARSRAVALGDIARLKADRGFVDEALALHEERLAIYEQFDDLRSRAVALGDIARLKTDRGYVDEAVSLHEEQLAIFAGLSDVRSQAVALGDIANLKADHGFIDEALSLHEEQLAIFDSLGDVRSRAVALGDIARLKADRGSVDEALALYEEILAIFTELGDVRSRTVTLGRIARLKARLGFLEEAMVLYEEELKSYEKLGDLDGQANCRCARAMLRLRKPGIGKDEIEGAFNDLIFAYRTLMKLGRADGIAVVGFNLARVLTAAGRHSAAREIAERSFALFTQLHWTKDAIAVREFLASLPPN